MGFCLNRVRPVTSLLLFAILPTAFLTGGCALGDRKIALLYEPASDCKAAPPQAVAVAKFDDLRQDKALVGEVRNGYGMKMAQVLLENQDAGGWVSNAVSAELERTGCQVAKVERPTDAGSVPVVQGAIIELYTKMYMTYDCRVKLKIQVTKSGVVLFNKDYEGKGGGLAVLVTAQEYEMVTKAALQDALKQATPQVLEAIK